MNLRYFSFVWLALSLVSCDRKHIEFAPSLSLEQLISPGVIEGNVSGLGLITIKGNSKEIVSVIERRYWVEGDKIYDSSSDLISGEKYTEETGEWLDPMDAERRKLIYRKVYETLRTTEGLFLSRKVDSFSVNATNEAIVLSFHQAHGSVFYIRYENEKVKINLQRGFLDKEILQRLFPTAEFVTSASDKTPADLRNQLEQMLRK